MILEISQDTELMLYEYFVSFRKGVPYYFNTGFEEWRQSMFDDCDYDGKPLFSKMTTYLLMEKDKVEGFIQYGLTNFAFDESGEKDYTNQYAVIRNIHFAEHNVNAHLLLEKAKDYFNNLDFNKRYAYFHYFGMSCYAKQGKLHDSEFYIEKLLCEHGFIKEHENVYYSKSLRGTDTFDASDVDFVHENNGMSISFMKSGEKIGGCELNFVACSDICFLKWIHINEKHSHKGLGTKCMNKLFHELKGKSISRLDTDTADKNTIAQEYYIKTGFSDMGRMRSYFTL